MATQTKDDLLIKLKTLVEINDEFSNQQVISLVDGISISTLLYPYGENLLHWAAAFNNPTICEYLLTKKHVHVNQQNQRGATPLYYACTEGSVSSAMTLLQHSASPVIRSGFSGQMPSEVTDDAGLIDQMASFRRNTFHFVMHKDKRGHLGLLPGFSLYDAYQYRRYMTWLALHASQITY